MSLAKSKEVLKQLIEDKNNKVIALTGRWGIGKTHLWEDLQRMHLNRKKPLNFSLLASSHSFAKILSMKISKLDKHFMSHYSEAKTFRTSRFE